MEVNERTSPEKSSNVIGPRVFFIPWVRKFRALRDPR